MSTRKYLNAGSSFLEYVLLFSVISAVFLGMNTYIKRGVNAKIKDMTDYFISSNQEGKTSKYVESNSETFSTVKAKNIVTGSLGGEMQIVLPKADNSAVTRSSVVSIDYSQAGTDSNPG